MGWLRPSVRRALVAGLALVLGTALLPRVAAATGTARAPRGDVVAASSATLELACGDVTVPLGVDAALEPAEVVDGGAVDVTWALQLPTADLGGLDGVIISIPLPTAVAALAAGDVVPGTGVVGSGWSGADGRLRVDLTPVDAPDAVAATVTVSADLRPGLAPTEVWFAAPDTVVLVGGAADGTDRTCTPTEPLTTLVGAVVAEATVPTTTSTTSVPAPPPATTPPATTPTTTPATPPTTLPVRDPAAGGDVPSATPPGPDEVPVVPAGVGSASRVVTGDAAGARARLDTAREDLVAAGARLAELEERSARIERRLRHLATERRQMAEKLRRRDRDLHALLAAAYVAAVDAEVTPQVPDTGSVPLAAALDHARLVYERLLAREGEVMAALADVTTDRADGRRDLDRAEARAGRLRAAVTDGRRQLTTFRLGGDLAITGFRFPVAGPHDFSDTWHAPRSGGRLHEGTDVFAAEGTPLRAVERGVLTGVGTGDLGGIKLWLVGESGTQYYYAHLSAYAEGVADGVVVAAGEVLGYVGHTGNARTTPPHLHFEVHPRGGDAIDGYPLLAAADGVAPPDADPGAAADADADTGAAASPGGDAPAAATPTTSEVPARPSPPVISERPDVAVGWGDAGVVAEGLGAPAALAAAADGTLVVADAGRDRIVVLSADGGSRRVWGSSGSAPGEFHEPQGVAVAPDGSVYVVDTGNGRVQRLSAAGEAIGRWDGSATPEGPFNAPTGVAVDARGRVYVVDSLNDRVRVFTADGEPVRSWGGFGDGPGRFADPTGIALGPDGDVYVADTYNGRVQRFTRTGEPVAEWRDGLRLPAALVVTDAGALLVVDRAPRAIRQFDADGALRRSWGRTGAPATQGGLAHPDALVLDRSGRLLVADTGHGRVLAYRWR